MHRVTGLKVAIKVMQAEKAALSREENGISESSAMELCEKNSNVASLIESFSQDGHVYIVTKFYRTGDMLGYLETKKVNKLPEAETRDLVKQLASGVRDIHDQGVVHRDIKHLNILISLS